MSRKSTINNSSETFLQSQSKGWTPEFKQILMSHGFVKQNDTETIKSNTEVNSSAFPIKVKAPILDRAYLDSSKDKFNHLPVQPIPTEYIPLIKEYFHKPSRYKENNLRNYAYFILDVNTARRSGDILNLTVRNILNEDGTFRDHIIITEQKTGKKTYTYMNNSVREALAEYLESKYPYNMSDLLFTNYKTGETLTVDAIRKAIKRCAVAIGMKGNFGSHSLRKTFIAELIKNNPNNKEIEMMASKALNHNNVETTYAYAGFTQTKMDNMFKSNQL